jgi:Skp family chaperone for outer membrane proteins
MVTMKYLFSAALVGSLFLFQAAHVRSTTPSTVTVSLQRIVAQSNTGKRATQQLEALRDERARELVAKQKELQGVAQQLAKGDALPAADRQRLTEDENRRRTELQQMTAKAQSEFQSAQQRLQNEVRAQLSPILADIANRYGVDIVMNSDTAVAWAAPGTDATNEVLQRLNAETR